MRPVLFLSLALVAIPRLHSEPPHFTSGPARVSLVELFTSEGCSSCPPAERWLGSLRNEAGLWRDFVPVAWHVDYWNRLGWPDRFSTREFTQREYDYAAAWRSSSVYTPCVVRDGIDAGSSRSVVPSGKTAGRLAVSYDGTKVHAEFQPAEPRAGDAFEVHAVILGAGIVSKVGAGENSGETLRHEFVALKLAHAALGQELKLAVPVVDGVPRHALAVWVTRRGELTPVQATGGWLD